MIRGTVEQIWVTPAGAEPMVSVDQVDAVAGKGLQGDRYFLGSGSYSDNPGAGRQVTLVEREAIEAIAHENDIHLEPGATRRNIVTSGVALNHLVGREFRVGEVVLLGVRLCEPCQDLARSIGQPIVTPLLHRAGLRADILEGGTIGVGAELIAD